MRFSHLFLLSLLTGILALSTRWTVLPLIPADFGFVFVSAACVIPWVFFQAIALLKYGKRDCGC
jgi:hypothetical protein